MELFLADVSQIHTADESSQLQAFLDEHRWIHLHEIRELAHHCGHADILREQLLSQRP